MQLRNFAKKLFLFLMPLILLLLILFFVLFNAGYYPAITNSASLDAKILDFRAHNFKNVDVLSIGSSMNLNNLNSSEMTMPDKSTIYYNFGAWGLQISDIFYLVKYFSNTHDLKCIVVSSSITDFNGDGKILLPSYYELDLTKHYLPYFYFKSNLISVISRHLQYRQYKEDKDGYTNLNFDDMGGATLNIPPDKISKSRWIQKLRFPNNNTEYQYTQLQELALYLRNKNIVFIYAQSPIKINITDSSETIPKIQAHFNKCKSIIDESGGYYINLHNPLIFTDSLYVDQYHLSEEGSKIYTKQIAILLNKILAK